MKRYKRSASSGRLESAQITPTEERLVLQQREADLRQREEQARLREFDIRLETARLSLQSLELSKKGKEMDAALAGLVGDTISQGKNDATAPKPQPGSDGIGYQLQLNKSIAAINTLEASNRHLGTEIDILLTQETRLVQDNLLLLSKVDRLQLALKSLNTENKEVKKDSLAVGLENLKLLSKDEDLQYELHVAKADKIIQKRIEHNLATANKRLNQTNVNTAKNKDSHRESIDGLRLKQRILTRENEKLTQDLADAKAITRTAEYDELRRKYDHLKRSFVEMDGQYRLVSARAANEALELSTSRCTTNLQAMFQFV